MLTMGRVWRDGGWEQKQTLGFDCNSITKEEEHFGSAVKPSICRAALFPLPLFSMWPLSSIRCTTLALRYSHCVQPISRTSFRTFFYPKGVGAMVGLAPTPTQPKLQSGQRPTTCSLWAHVHTCLHVHRHVPSGGTKTSLIAGSNGLCLPEKVEATEPQMCRLESWGSCVQVTRQVVNSCPKLRSPSRTSHSESRSKNIIAKLIVWG